MRCKNLLKIVLVYDLLALGLIACTSSDEDINNKNTVVIEGINSIGKSTCASDEEMNSSVSNALFREYTIGRPMSEGTVSFSKYTISATVNNPESIVVFYNNEVLETLPYDNKEVFEYEITKSGYYGFFALDSSGTMEELTGGAISVDALVNQEPVIPLD